MQLGFIAPVVTAGKPVAKLNIDEVAKGSSKWESAIIFYVVGSTPTITALFKFIAQQWNFVAKPLVYKHDEGYFMIRFASVEDKNAVLQSGPHMFNNKPTVVKPWKPHFYFHAEILNTVPLWVRLPNLALNCWSMDCLSRICSLLGTPICADECTSRQLRVSFARVLVEMDVTKPLPKSVVLEDPQGKLIEQKVWYEWALPFCVKCQKVGHVCGESKSTDKRKNVQKQWVPKATQPAGQKNPEVVVVEPTEPEPVVQPVPPSGVTPTQVELTTPVTTVQPSREDVDGVLLWLGKQETKPKEP